MTKILRDKEEVRKAKLEYLEGKITLEQLAEKINTITKEARNV